MGDVNSAGCYLAISLIVAVNSILVDSSLARRAGAIVGAAAVLVGLIYTQTLTAIGAAIGAVGMLAAVDLYLMASSRWRPRWLALGGLAGLLAAGAAGATFAQQNQAFRERLVTRYQDFRAGNWADLTSYRAPVFAVTWRMAMEYPDRKSTRLNSSHIQKSRMPSSA